MEMECIIQVDGEGVVNRRVYTFIGERKPRLACWALSVRPSVTLTLLEKCPGTQAAWRSIVPMCTWIHVLPRLLYTCFIPVRDVYIYIRVGMGYAVDLHSAREANHSWQACCNYRMWPGIRMVDLERLKAKHDAASKRKSLSRLGDML